MGPVRYYLVLVLLTLAALACLAAVTTYGMSPAGLAAGVGLLICVAVFLSYGLTMRGRHTPINR